MNIEGWCQVAFERELTGELTPVWLGTAPLVLARTAGGLRAFDAACPHRGAHLGYGGCLDGERVICPFHGYRIGLGAPADEGYRVREYPTLTIGGLIFVRLSERHELGLPAILRRLDATHFFVPGFARAVCAPPELVIENAFDSGHFRTVHGVRNDPRFTVGHGTDGELLVEGVFEYPPPLWQQRAGVTGTIRAPFVARAFSPYLALTRLEGEPPYWVITGATPNREGGCTIRLSVAVPPSAAGGPPDPDFCRQLLHYSEGGIEQDIAVWDHLIPIAAPRLTGLDTGVAAFRAFVAAFSEESVS